MSRLKQTMLHYVTGFEKDQSVFPWAATLKVVILLPFCYDGLNVSCSNNSNLLLCRTVVESKDKVIVG